MTTLSHLLIMMIALALAGAASAQIYKIEREDGSVYYTDRPPPDIQIEPAVLPDIIIQPPTRISPEVNPRSDAGVPSSNYQLEIVSPLNETVIHGAGQSVAVSATISPTLGEGMQLQLLLGGQPFGAPQSASDWQLGPLNPGAHQVSVQLLSPSGEPLTASTAITIYVIPRVAR